MSSTPNRAQTYTRDGEPSEPERVLLYDGVCGFCNWTVRFIIAQDRRGTMRFAPLQGEYGAAVVARHPWLATVDSVVLVETASDGTEQVFVRSTAALRVAEYLGGWWRLLTVAYALPTALRDWLYDLFAAWRYQLFGKYDTCLTPSPDIRMRFL
ncbi:MAG: DCC1-like thiol-disulfide oxidoreductase family protein [Chloracidobacterium sp.]|nr:DCC1-like thiol-disulfide oxidoreductase family protein [Chloracidobacterium sp.]MDW8218847.1 DCC1-like thiol-disulfide oxidoreductase family protein [Acidobacteriota bacterium]